jgi:hypothetical protein
VYSSILLAGFLVDLWLRKLTLPGVAYIVSSMQLFASVPDCKHHCRSVLPAVPIAGQTWWFTLFSKAERRHRRQAG